MTETTLIWNNPAWLASAHAWIQTALAQNLLTLKDEITQPHIRPWSTVLRVPTNAGVLYFKATDEVSAYETALTDYLARFRPELFPQVLAVDFERHWFLMRAAGIPLRQFVRAEKSVARWKEVLPLYVGLQKDLTPHVEDLFALGVPDRSLAKLPSMFVRLIEDESAMLLDFPDPDSLTREEYARLKESVPEFTQQCERLAAFGIPETLHHDDFHDANIFVDNGKILFTDWGECAVTHPFFTLVVIMRSVDNSMGMDYSPEAGQVRDMYLSHWTSYAPLAELRTVVKIAQRVGYVNRALTWHNVILHLPDALKSEYAIAVPAYLKDFINDR